MWLGGLAPVDTLLENTGVMVWQSPQSPLVGWFVSSVAFGRESPAVVLVLAIIPRKAALWWQVVHVPTCPGDRGVASQLERRRVDVRRRRA